MTDTDESDDLEIRLRQAFRAPLPAAPWSLIERTEAITPVQGVQAPSRRPRLALFLVPAAVALLLFAVAFNAGRPSPPTNGFEMHPVRIFEGEGWVLDLWTVRSTFYAIVWGVTDGREVTEFARSKNGETWTREVPPRDGFVAASGTVVGDELHVLGHTGTYADPVWWHYTIDDRGWHEVGEMTGMPGSTFVTGLVRGTAGWLARIGMHGPEIPEGDSGSAIRYSQDGLHWAEVADAPRPTSFREPKPATLPIPIYYTGVTTDGSKLLVFRHLDTNDRAPTEAIVSSDGRTWTVHTVPSSVPSRGAASVPGPKFAVHDGQQFVAVGSIEGGGEDWSAAAWTSTDAMTWVLQTVGQPGDAVPGDFRLIASTEQGFVAISSENEVWMSPNGATWRSFDVIRDGSTLGPVAVAAMGDTLIVGGVGPNNQPVVWLRRLELPD